MPKDEHANAFFVHFDTLEVVVETGVDPVTSRFSGARSTN